MALSYLRDAFGTDIPERLLNFPGISSTQLALVDQMLSRRINTVETSSCGRLFDAVAALLGLASEVTFEGQAAIALETAAARYSGQRPCPETYPYDIEEAAAPMQLDLRATLVAIANDVSRGRRAGEIASRFHNTLADAIAEICRRIRKDVGLDHVCLTGGTFQNHILLVRTVLQLRCSGFKVSLHAQVPANDGGLALGQAVIAGHILRRYG
jgi:hydrogenase maturation protein HypF